NREVTTVDALVGAVVQTENSSVQGNARKQTLGSGIGVDCGFQQNVGSDFRAAPNGPGCCRSVRAKFQFAFKQWLDSLTVRKDHNQIRCLYTKLQAEAAAADVNKQR